MLGEILVVGVVAAALLSVCFAIAYLLDK